jgi:hypothetical protein
MGTMGRIFPVQQGPLTMEGRRNHRAALAIAALEGDTVGSCLRACHKAVMRIRFCRRHDRRVGR